MRLNVPLIPIAITIERRPCAPHNSAFATP